MKQFEATGVYREAYGVFVWSLIACILRLCLFFLVALSKLRLIDDTNGDGAGDDDVCLASESICLGGTIKDHRIIGEIITMISVLASWILAILPKKVASQTAPGFLFGSTWILYPMRDMFGFIPNLPCRICETKMGRISLRELAVFFPIHFLVPMLAFWIVQLLLPSAIFAQYAIDPVTYSEKNPWIIDFVRETFVNALFTVGLLVIPELLRINGAKRGYTLLILYPLYSFGVDADGKASVFGPNLIYALRCVSKHEEVPITQLSHLLGPILGGVIGGSIMKRAFPDDK